MFLDETGFMLQPVVRHTRAPQGETPIQYVLARHDRLSAARQLRESRARWLDVEWLPAYAPDLSPVEAM